MKINEFWNYLLSFTIYGSDEYIHYKIIATIFLIIGIFTVLDAFTKPFLLKGGKLIKFGSSPRGNDESSGIITLFMGISGMSFAIHPLLYIAIPFFIFILLHEMIFK